MNTEIRKIISALLVLVFLGCLIFSANKHRFDGYYGWGKNIDGRTVVVSVFADCDDCVWDEDSLAEYEEYEIRSLGIACDWISQRTAEYGADTELIYDWSTDPKLRQQAVIKGNLTGQYPDTKAVDGYLDDLEESRMELMRRYRTDSVIYIFFTNTEAEHDYPSLSYMWMNEGDPEDEFTIIYKSVDFEWESPAVYAHEMLHLFGAFDFYTVDGYGYESGVTEEYIRHLEETGSNDIMFTICDISTGLQNYDKITNGLSEVDAYYLGIIPRCEEVYRWGLGLSSYDRIRERHLHP